MKKVTALIIAIVFTASFYSVSAQDIKDSTEISVFVYKDKNVTTPLNALRATLTSSLVNATNGSYIVLDRTEEILDKLNEVYSYHDSGMVRDDQIIEVGGQLGEKFLYVVYVTYYKDYNQFFFEGKFINVEKTSTPKEAFYPDEDKGQLPITSLAPQEQVRVGRALAQELGLMSKEEIETQQQRLAKQEQERQAALQRQEAENKQRELEAKKERERQERASRSQRIKEGFTNALSDWSSVGIAAGGGGNGFQISMLYNIKLFSIGIGMNVPGEGKYFPIKKGENLQGDYLVEYNSVYHEAKYYCNTVGVHFSAGFNFKYVGIALCPELYFIADTHEYVDSYGYTRTTYEGPSDYVRDHYSHALVGLTPTLFFNVPFDFDDSDACLGLIGSVGYTFIPEIGHNPGFQFSFGIGVFWH